jgi:hypothetical protein
MIQSDMGHVHARLHVRSPCVSRKYPLSEISRFRFQSRFHQWLRTARRRYRLLGIDVSLHGPRRWTTRAAYLRFKKRMTNLWIPPYSAQRKVSNVVDEYLHTALHALLVKPQASLKWGSESARSLTYRPSAVAEATLA